MAAAAAPSAPESSCLLGEDRKQAQVRHRDWDQWGGALIAPLAFLGSAHDDQLKQALSAVKDANIYRKHSLLGALSSASFTSNAPLAKMLDKCISSDVLANLAQESVKRPTAVHRDNQPRCRSRRHLGHRRDRCESQAGPPETIQASGPCVYVHPRRLSAGQSGSHGRG